MRARHYLAGASGAVLLLGLAWVGRIGGAAPEVSGTRATLRRPVALVPAADGKRLYVANRRCGTVSVVDLAWPRVVTEAAAGRMLADLAAVPGGRSLVAVDEAAHELIVLDIAEGSVRVAGRLAVSPYPVGTRVSPDDKACAVASVWSRRLTLVELAPAPRVRKALDLPFAPRALLFLPGGGKLLVADAFGGKLAVVDVVRAVVESVRELPGHNLRSLALTPDGGRVLVTYQVLDPRGRTSFDDIHWGNLLTNAVRVLSVADLLDAKADLTAGGRVIHLGDVGRGGADPAGIVVTPGGAAAVALAGAGEVALGGEKAAAWERVTVGRRPTAVAQAAGGRRAYVANTFDDSVSVIDLERRKVESTVALGQTGDLSAADRGELLFYDGRLSHDGWLSCHSCHTDGHTNGRLNDGTADGGFGTPKRVLSLLGVRDTKPYAWNGSIPDLESQVRRSVEASMQGPKPTAAQVADLTAYLQTLVPPPPAARDDTAAARRGKEVFARHGCADCHTPPTYTSPKTYDVGLRDESGADHFNPPSLRGVGQGGPYFHDGRAASLRDVFVTHRHQLQGELEKEELDDLLAYLRSL